jgi:hypothetical protein
MIVVRNFDLISTFVDLNGWFLSSHTFFLYLVVPLVAKTPFLIELVAK